MNTHATQVIEALGGTVKVAQMFEIKPPSVSEWKEAGIPKGRVMYLRAKRFKALRGLDLYAATAAPRGAK